MRNINRCGLTKVFDELSNMDIHVGGHWEAKEKQDWSMCPDIF